MSIPNHVPAEVVRSASQVDMAFQGSTPCEVKRFDTKVTTAGTHNLVDGVAGKRILIRSLDIRPLESTAVDVHLQTEDDPSTPLMGMDADDPQPLDLTGVAGSRAWSSRGIRTAGR